jgi:hypothetical protein
MTRARMLLLGALALLAAGCQRADDGTASELRALRQELRMLRTNGADATPARALPADELRSALTPLQQALETISSRHDADRARWGTLADDVQQLAQMVSGTLGAADKGRLEALQQRLNALEQSLGEQRTTHAQEQQLIRNALEHTVEKLDLFLQRVRKLEPATTPPETEPAKPDRAPDGNGDERRSSVDLTLVLLGAALVLLLVTLVILFPGTLGRGKRPPVVQLRTQDEGDDDITPQLLEAMEAVVLEPDDCAEQPPIVEAAEDTSMPWRVEQRMPCARPAEVGAALRERLVEDPRVLVEPPPSVETDDDELVLRYHLAPHLTRAEAERLRGEVESLAIEAAGGDSPGKRNGFSAA